MKLLQIDSSISGGQSVSRQLTASIVARLKQTTQGLAGGKKLIIASSRGGFYTASSPMAFMDHQETFLTSFFGFIGISDAAFIRAEGVGSGPEQRKRALETALADVSALKAA